MITETITWRPIASGLPDPQTNVLLSAGELGTFEGFLDGIDEAGEPVWRDVTAMPVSGVTDWSYMPKGRGRLLTLCIGTVVDLGARWSMPS